MPAIQVTIFEVHHAVRQALETLIQNSPGFELTGTFPNASQVVLKLGQTRPTSCLWISKMPGVNGIEAVSTIKATFSLRAGDRSDSLRRY